MSDELEKLKARVETLTQEKNELKQQLHAAKKQNTVLQIREQTREAAAGRVSELALPDVLVRAEHLFELSNGKDALTKENCGVTAGIGPHAWLDEVLPKYPHWLPEHSPASAPKEKSGAEIKDNPWLKANWNLTRQGEYLRQHGEAKAQAAAAAAGLTLGASKPVK